jgi:hydrogenase nickel incorporation protein HypB
LSDQQTTQTTITVQRRILDTNDQLADAIRRRLTSAGTFVVNLISSPGAGKTTLIEKTAELLDGNDRPLRWAVVEGDIATEQDADRVRKHGVPAVQINTHGDCHLDARMLTGALEALDRETQVAKLDLLVVENVGNLVCPVEFDLGEDAKVVVASVAEGDDKPSKYPSTFGRAAAMVVNKIDLLPYVDCNLDRMVSDARGMNPALAVIPVSCRTGEGLESWIEWLRAGVASKRAAAL